jgi:hypothetical protein
MAVGTGFYSSNTKAIQRQNNRKAIKGDDKAMVKDRIVTAKQSLKHS